MAPKEATRSKGGAKIVKSKKPKKASKKDKKASKKDKKVGCGL